METEKEDAERDPPPPSRPRKNKRVGQKKKVWKTEEREEETKKGEKPKERMASGVEKKRP